MKFSIFALVAGIASVVSAQAGAAEPPKCGTTIMISAISSSGCGITEVQCMCKNTNLIKQVKEKIPKACSAEADRAVFAMFFNSQCIGQPGFPITIGTPGSGDNKGAANGASVTSGGGAKPATATGTSDGRNTRASFGVLALAGAVAIALS